MVNFKTVLKFSPESCSFDCDGRCWTCWTCCWCCCWCSCFPFFPDLWKKLLIAWRGFFFFEGSIVLSRKIVWKLFWMKNWKESFVLDGENRSIWDAMRCWCKQILFLFTPSQFFSIFSISFFPDNSHLILLAL